MCLGQVARQCSESNDHTLRLASGVAQRDYLVVQRPNDHKGLEELCKSE